MCVGVCVCVCICICMFHDTHIERTTRGSHFSPSTMLVPEIELRSLGCKGLYPWVTLKVLGYNVGANFLLCSISCFSHCDNKIPDKGNLRTKDFIFFSQFEETVLEVGKWPQQDLEELIARVCSQEGSWPLLVYSLSPFYCGWDPNPWDDVAHI